MNTAGAQPASAGCVTAVVVGSSAWLGCSTDEKRLTIQEFGSACIYSIIAAVSAISPQTRKYGCRCLVVEHDTFTAASDRPYIDWAHPSYLVLTAEPTSAIGQDQPL